MKPLSPIAAALAAAFALTACSFAEPPGMSIKPSEFSKETQKVLDLFKDEMQFFDLSLDETAQSYTISVWVYRDGQWYEDGKTLGDVQHLEEQIAVRLTDTSFDLYTMDENGHVKYSYPALETTFEDSMGVSSTKILSETPLHLNDETPLWVKVGTGKNQMEVLDISEDFRNMDCNAGVAVTLTISDEIAD